MTSIEGLDLELVIDAYRLMDIDSDHLNTHTYAPPSSSWWFSGIIIASERSKIDAPFFMQFLMSCEVKKLVSPLRSTVILR